MKNTILIISLLSLTSLTAQNTIEALKKSYTLEASKKYAEAIQSLEAVKPPRSYAVNLRLGWLNYLRGEYLASKAYYKKAIEMENKSIEAQTGLIYPITAMGNWDEVITVYNSILSSEPTNTNALYQLAYIYSVRKEYTKSAEYLKKMLALYPFNFNGNSLLGYVYVKMGKIKEAKIYYTKALEYNPSSEEIKKALEGL